MNVPTTCVIRALAMRVLAVAVPRPEEGGWCAYVDAVRGENHREEAPAVAAHGEKMGKRVAVALFGFEESAYIE